MLASKFCDSGPSLAMNSRTTCRDATALERPSARATRGGMRRSCGWNRAGARGERQKFGETSFMEFGGLQPVETPQNRQSFLWKSLQKTSGDLEKLAEKAGRRASIPPSLLPPATPRRRSRGQAALRGREGKFSYPQSLEKSRNGKILPGPPAVSPYDTDAPPGSTARGITARRPSRAPTGAARSWRRS
jgi:hypothetical protein